MIPLRSIAANERRTRLLDLVRTLAYMEGDFVLASGARSNFYLDCRLVTLHPVGALLIGGFVIEYAKKLGVTCVGGPTLAADPVVGAVVGLSPLYDWPCQGFIVRKAAKEHGASKLIEGHLPEDKPVLVVEDTITTAGSVIKAVEAVRARGNRVAGVWGLVDRMAGGREALEAIDVELHSMFTIDEVRAHQPTEERFDMAPWEKHWKGW